MKEKLGSQADATQELVKKNEDLELDNNKLIQERNSLFNEIKEVEAS